MRFNIPWIDTGHGPGLREGSRVTLSADGARCILFGVYKDGFPIIIGQSMDGQNSIPLMLKRSAYSIKGPAVLKITAYNKTWNASGFEAHFTII